MLGLTAAQVFMISQQNQKLDQQTYLAEASRRGALTAEFAALSERVGTLVARGGVRRRATGACDSLRPTVMP